MMNRFYLAEATTPKCKCGAPATRQGAEEALCDECYREWWLTTFMAGEEDPEFDVRPMPHKNLTSKKRKHF